MKILYQDDWLMAIEKPAGLPTLPASRGKKQTLASELLQEFPKLKKISDNGIVHRLDNDTSGIVVIAKTENAYRILREVWNTDQVTKTYVAVVLGRLIGSGILQIPIVHHPKKKKKMMVDKQKGRPALTEWKTIRQDNGQTWVELKIKTGVRHQIRLHLASIGFPIVGDLLYQKVKQRLLNPSGIDHHLLHLTKVDLIHPETGKKLSIESPANFSF